MKTVAVFADVGNLFHCISKKFPGRKLNYKKYLEQAVGENNLHQATAYGSQINNEASKFITCLQHIGFDVKYRLTRANYRINWSTGIAMDVVRVIDKVDTVILGTGAEDIRPLVEWIKERGVRVIILACGINRDVREASHEWIELDSSFLEEEKNEAPTPTE